MDRPITNKSYKVPNQMFFEIIESELKTGKSVKFNVAGNSMLPFLKDSDQVVIKQPNLQVLHLPSSIPCISINGQCGAFYFD